MAKAFYEFSVVEVDRLGQRHEKTYSTRVERYAQVLRKTFVEYQADDREGSDGKIEIVGKIQRVLRDSKGGEVNV